MVTKRQEIATERMADVQHLSRSDKLAQSPKPGSKSNQHEGEMLASRPGSSIRRQSPMGSTIPTNIQQNILAAWSRWPDTPKIEESAECYDNLQRSTPASFFELSSSFFPEAYATIEATSRLVAYMNYQEHAMDYSRVNRYEMFYCKAPREWVRLSISATVSVESPYWKVISIPSKKSNMIDLPAGLSKKLEVFLTSRLDLEQGSRLGIYLGNQATSNGHKEKSDLLMQVSKPQVLHRLKGTPGINPLWGPD
ncbi:hypothetical protein F4818DRAFT_455884 [Hypoxylon cercidicola]|nr:hypothetical protein F4818DRAFT_455884 [Hypoxylon cercidicola]